MIMPTANGGIAQQTADSQDAEKNIFSDESHGDDERRVGDGERRVGNEDQRRGNNDPRHNKQPRQNNQPRRDKRDVHGWVVLDKPIGMTSTHAVAVLKRLFQAKRAGHAGTLDPLASGGLPIALGEATKTVPFVMDGRKRYRFTVAWGCLL
jgi:tRNA pseudouridine55 synthase